jgi:hypothetical protein
MHPMDIDEGGMGCIPKGLAGKAIARCEGSALFGDDADPFCVPSPLRSESLKEFWILTS